MMGFITLATTIHPPAGLSGSGDLKLRLVCVKCWGNAPARARNIYQGYLDYNGALTELELARQALPNDSRVFELMGYIQRRQPGRYEESYAKPRARP